MVSVGENTDFISNYQIFPQLFLFLALAQLLYIDGMFHLETLQNRRLVILLTLAQLFHDAGLLILSLKLLQRSFEVFTIFYGYDNHSVLLYYLNC